MRRVIVTDFDGTLTTSDTLIEFILYAKGRLNCLTGFILFSPLIVLMKMKLYPNGRVKERLFAHFFRGMRIERFESLGRDFATDSRHLLRSGGLQMVDQADNDGTEVIIVTASIRQWVQPFFPRTIVLATEIEVIDGVITGRFSTPNCYGIEKVHRLRKVIVDREQCHIVAYGDSSGDRAMMQYADESHYKPWRD